MLATVLLLIAGIALLLVGGTALVRGASAIASALGVSQLVVGLTVVAFGTSSPELVVNLLAAVEDQPGLAFGNIVGSSIANLALVLGAAALVTPIALEGKLITREIPLLLLVTAVLLVMVLDLPLRDEQAVLDRSDGIVLFLLFGIFVYTTARDIFRRHKDPLMEGVQRVPVPAAERIGFKEIGYVLAGIAMLGGGGHLTITHGADLAEMAGFSPATVGVAVIAVGTSLPELVTSLIAALRKEPDLSVGNVVGSNLFNTLFVLPAGAIVAPMHIPTGGAIDIAISFGLALLLIPIFIVGRNTMGRSSGAAFLLIYVGYIGYRIWA